MKLTQLRLVSTTNSPLTFYHGNATGNSFLMVEIEKALSIKNIKACLIGALNSYNKDSALVLKHLNEQIYKMYVIEKDESESSFCGNGARFIARYLYERKQQQLAYLETDDNSLVKIGKDEDHYFVECGLPITNKPISIGGHNFGYYKVCGEPHLVTHEFFNDNKLIKIARQIRKEHSINISCVDSHFILTYERGVEDITQSCGTACVAASKYYFDNNLVELIYHNKLPWYCLGGTNFVEMLTYKLSGKTEFFTNPLPENRSPRISL